MTTYKDYAVEHPTIQIDERLYAKEIPHGFGNDTRIA